MKRWDWRERREVNKKRVEKQSLKRRRRKMLWRRLERWRRGRR